MKQENVILFNENKYAFDYFRCTKVVSFSSIDIATLNIYFALLPFSSSSYPGVVMVEEFLQDLYGACISPSLNQYDDKLFLTLYSESLNENYCPKETFFTLIKFMHDLYKDDLIIDSNLFENRKKNLILAIKRRNKNPFSCCTKGLFENVDKDNPINNDLMGTVEDVEKVTIDDILKIHEIVRKAPYYVFFQGNLTKEKEDFIYELFNENLKLRTYDFPPLKFKDYVYGEEEGEFKSTIIKSLYHFDFIYSLHNLVVIRLASEIIGGNSSILFKEIREKQGLCYNISLTPYISQNVMVLSSIVDNSNKEKAYESIAKIFLNLESYYVDEMLDIAKMDLITEKYQKIDDGENAFLTKSSVLLKRGELYTVEEEIKAIKSVTKEEILSVFRNLKLIGSYSVIGVM